MSAIRSKHNRTTEHALIKIFKKSGIKGWRRHSKSVYGKPDFIFPKLKTAVFVDGCFWHGCPQIKKLPKNNAAFWKKKIHGNKQRDKVVNKELKRQGWGVLRIWEHNLKNEGKITRLIEKFNL